MRRIAIFSFVLAIFLTCNFLETAWGHLTPVSRSLGTGNTVGTNDILNFNGAVGLPSIYKMDLDYPQQAAIGIALHPNKVFLVDFDVKWVDWSSTHDKVDFKGPANSFDITGDGIGDVDSTKLHFGWEDQYVYALGAQYSMTDRLNLRAGVNYAKSPINEADIFNNLIFPALVETHVTLGFDYQLGDHWGMALPI